MQFETKTSDNYFSIRITAGIFDSTKFKVPVIESFKNSFQRIGGKLQDDYFWKFPPYINLNIIQEIIHNTCFVCGGLMKDSTAMVDQQLEFEHDIYGTVTQQVPGYAKQIKVRKCSSCGHSHT